ncbi:hypothetical protein [Streptomyces sp. NPDC058657]|uniref:hypothetical protein n=1 Tax=unclassified Streptomyces TaxID=2593676 RepID=UPI003664E3C8
MSVTLDKTPRAFTVLISDEGTVTAVLPTPATNTHSELDAYAYGNCLEVHDVEAIDRYAAHMTAVASRQRERAIADCAEKLDSTEDIARTIYRDCRIWARSLTPNGRAHWHSFDFESCGYLPIKRFALEEVMRENGELLQP